jgi:anaerobic ribonucleoside-triphosphate reductase
MTDLSNQSGLEVIELQDAERQPCEIWTRVMGYHRPVASFNTGKKGEFHERQYFCESAAQQRA